MMLNLLYNDTLVAGLIKFDVALGRYVIMPDHVHLLVRGGRNFTLSSWIGGLKRAIVCRDEGLRTKSRCVVFRVHS